MKHPKIKQLEIMMEQHQRQKDAGEEIINKLKNYWENLAKGFSINKNGISKIRKWLNKFEFNEILKAMDISATHYLEWDGEIVTDESWEEAFYKVGAILVVNSQSKVDASLKDLYYIRGILRKRLYYHHPHHTIKWLEAAMSWGATVDELKEIALTTKNWTAFSQDIDDIIKRCKKNEE